MYYSISTFLYLERFTLNIWSHDYVTRLKNIVFHSGSLILYKIIQFLSYLRPNLSSTSSNTPSHYSATLPRVDDKSTFPTLEL